MSFRVCDFAIGRLTAAAAVLVVAAAVNPAWAQDGAIKYRQATMKAVGGHMGAMASILKGEVDRPGDLPVHANAMSDLADNVVPHVFPEGSDFGSVPTDVKMDIWNKPDEFQAAVDKMKTEAAKLAEVAGDGDMKAFANQFKQLGGACKNCHDGFRKEKQ